MYPHPDSLFPPPFYCDITYYDLIEDCSEMCLDSTFSGKHCKHRRNSREEEEGGFVGDCFRKMLESAGGLKSYAFSNQISEEDLRSVTAPHTKETY